MHKPLRIHFHGVDSSPALETRIREEVDALHKVHAGITGCQVNVRAPHQHHRHGAIYEVHIDLTVPGKELAVGREPGKDHAHEDVFVAVRDAFLAARRRLEKEADRAHGDVKRRE